MMNLYIDACNYLVDILEPITNVSRNECIDRLIESIEKQLLKTTVISRDNCLTAVEECNKEQKNQSDNILEIIDCFNDPKFRIAEIDQKDKSATVESSLFGDGNCKIKIFLERFKIIYEKTKRHELFSTPANGVIPSSTKKYNLKPVEYLLSSSSKLGDIIVLGLLSRLKQDKWYVEDATGSIPLNLTNTEYYPGLITEGCIVLVEGSFDDGLFHVKNIGFPPPESATNTRAYIGNVNTFGGSSSRSLNADESLLRLEKQNRNAMFVFLSDVCLNDTIVMDKLHTMMTGYESIAPIAFILCGNFSSKPYHNEHYDCVSKSLKQFVDMVCEFPTIRNNSHFIFIPGPDDLTPSGRLFPKAPLFKTLSAYAEEKLNKVTFASNPIRIRYCTQEIVVFRDDLTLKLCRNCIKFPKDDDLTKHVARTIVTQGHLSPLPLHVSPVFWRYDAALRMNPLPDLIVISDSFKSFSTVTSDCNIISPGSFSRSSFNFKVYYPANKQVEDCEI